MAESDDQQRRAASRQRRKRLIEESKARARKLAAASKARTNWLAWRSAASKPLRAIATSRSMRIMALTSFLGVAAATAIGMHSSEKSRHSGGRASALAPAEAYGTRHGGTEQAGRQLANSHYRRNLAHPDLGNGAIARPTSPENNSPPRFGTPSLWPVPGGVISSSYGWRRDPTMPGKREMHKGIDIAAGRGAPVLASGNGKVAIIRRTHELGNELVIYHGNGIESVYDHLLRIPARIHIGSAVRRGEVIAYVGSTGKSTGYHLHFAIRKRGRFIDPMRYLRLQTRPGNQQQASLSRMHD